MIFVFCALLIVLIVLISNLISLYPIILPTIQLLHPIIVFKRKLANVSWEISWCFWRVSK